MLIFFFIFNNKRCIKNFACCSQKSQFNNWYDKMNVRIVNSAGQIIKHFSSHATTGQTPGITVYDLTADRYWLSLQSGTAKQLL